MPLEPEFIVPQDGHDKQDCESRAARRWLAGMAGVCPPRPGLPRRRSVLPPAGLRGGAATPADISCSSANQIRTRPLRSSDRHRAAEQIDAVSGVGNGSPILPLAADVPLRADAQAMTVNWLTIEITDAGGEVTYTTASSPICRSIATTSPNSPPVAGPAGRSRTKRFNVLKTKGYNLEHNFGHGKQNLATCAWRP